MKCMVITEVDEGPAFAQSIFQRKYRQSAPNFPHHIVALGRQVDGAWRPLSYLHLTASGPLMLAGGAATDGEVLRAMPEEVRSAAAAAGGLMKACLCYGFEKFGPSFEAVAACCGDARALQVTPQVGFEPTSTPHLLMHWLRPTSPSRRQELINMARSAMPF